MTIYEKLAICVSNTPAAYTPSINERIYACKAPIFEAFTYLGVSDYSDNKAVLQAHTGEICERSLNYVYASKFDCVNAYLLRLLKERKLKSSLSLEKPHYDCDNTKNIAYYGVEIANTGVFGDLEAYINSAKVSELKEGFVCYLQPTFLYDYGVIKAVENDIISVGIPKQKLSSPPNINDCFIRKHNPNELAATRNELINRFILLSITNPA